MDAIFTDQTTLKAIRQVFENHIATALIEARALGLDLQTGSYEKLLNGLTAEFSHDGQWTYCLENALYAVEDDLSQQEIEEERAVEARHEKDMRRDYYAGLINLRAAE